MGAGMATPCAVVVLSEDARQRSAQPEERKQLEASLTATLERINRDGEAHEKIAFIAIADGPWSIGNGLLTPTLKVKRNALEFAYRELLQIWAQDSRPVIWESAPGRAAGAA
jgi:hypothetical protein